MGKALDKYLEVWPTGEISELAHAAILELQEELAAAQRLAEGKITLNDLIRAGLTPTLCDKGKACTKGSE